MSDFLTHLIDRAAGRAPLLERRPRALFEPAESGGAAALEEQRVEVEAEVPRAAPLQRDAVELPAAHGENPSAPAATVAVRPAVNGIQPPAVPREPKSAPSVMTEGAAPQHPLQVPVRETVLRTERITTVVAAKAPAVPAAADATPAPSSRRPVKSTAEAAAEPAPARARRQADGNGEPRRAPALRAAEQRDPPQSVPAVRPQRQATAAVLIAKAQAGSKVPLPAAAAPPAPVQISIGRVEVRAHGAAEPRPRPAAAAAAPKLKLDDYLRQRSGGTS